MKFNYLLFILIININVVFAGILRDSEIEETIEQIVKPLKAAAKLKDLKIYIYDDLNPNAFTAGSNEIFIGSGLIINFPDPDVLRGVVAHEIGHILGWHISRRAEVIDNYNKAGIGGMILGLATALSGEVSPALAIMMSGMHFSERSILAYSRAFEISADQTALRLLEQSGHSAIGLMNFFKESARFSSGYYINTYDQTHPTDNERLSIIGNFIKESKFSNSQNTKELTDKYFKCAAKLAAYTLEIDQITNNKFRNVTNEVRQYIDAIKYFRLGNFVESLTQVNNLITQHPNDPFFHELRAQIYFESGDEKALAEYELVRKMRPYDPLIRLGLAVVGMSGTEDLKILDKYHKDLLFVLDKEKDNLLALYYNAIYYDKANLKGKSYLNTAIIALYTGKIEEAKNMARSAMKILPEKSADWFKAGDILAATE